MKELTKEQQMKEESERTKYLILENKIKCNTCNDEIVSESGHDFKFCSCKGCAVDGGHMYLRRVGGNYTDMSSSIYYKDQNDIVKQLPKIREMFKWGTYGTSGDETLRRILLKDLSTDHIKAILSTQRLVDWVSIVFKAELAYRDESKGE